MKKERFLDILMEKSPEELNEYIQKYGKKPKLVNVITFMKDDEDKDQSNKAE